MTTVSTKKILIVDDEATTLEMARFSLELDGGWEVFLAATATDGLAMAQEKQPDAILIEVKMRRHDGPTVLQTLMADETTRHIPVILLTEQMAPAEKMDYRESGVAGLIPKPFHALDLPRQVAMLLGWQPYSPVPEIRAVERLEPRVP